MTAAGQETILELKDVKKYFPIRSGFFQRKVGDIKAVDGVSFSLKRGETLGIVGESGCGKSTAGRTMIRLYKPTDGRILFKGQDISGLSEEKLRKSVRKNIQMVFQDPFASLNPRKTLRSIIKEPFQTHHMYSMSERNERVEAGRARGACAGRCEPGSGRGFRGAAPADRDCAGSDVESRADYCG